MKIDEKSFEDLLYKAMMSETGVEALIKRGWKDLRPFKHSRAIRQLNLREYGIPDIVRISFEGYYIYIEVIELKVTDFNISHLLQLGRYLACVRKIIKDTPWLGSVAVLRGILIVNGYSSDNDYIWLNDILEGNISVYNSTFDVNGIEFTKIFPSDWAYTNADHSLRRFINPSPLKELFKSAVKERQASYQGIDELPF